MKKRIIIGLGLHTLVFILGGLYIITTINGATARLDRLIQLHQVEILREHYLLQVRKVQTNLALRHSRHPRTFETIVATTRNMQMFIATCIDCHHEPEPLERIADLKRRTGLYQDALSRILTVRASEPRVARLEDEAYHLGENLIGQVGEMIAMTGSRLDTETRQTVKKIEHTRYLLYLLVAVAPIVSTWLGFIFISSLTSPVRVLVAATKKLEGGDLDHRIVGLRDEFGQVASAVNEMAGSLKEQMLKLQRTEQMVVVAELAAGLAHEIKNPLAGIKVAMHVLAAESYLNDEDREVLRKVGHEVTRLESLMKSFLSFARPRRPQLEATDVNSLLNTTLALYSGSHSRMIEQGKGVRFDKRPGVVPQTMADPMQLQQVFLNLVINAIEAMPDGGTLTMMTSHDPERGVVAVEFADTGPGIDPDKAEQVFQPFFTSKPKGTGLGLAISQQLVEQHDGRIVLSGGSGSGARFVIELPVVPVGAESQA